MGLLEHIPFQGFFPLPTGPAAFFSWSLGWMPLLLVHECPSVLLDVLW
jgi:hypothetical protein